MKTVRLQLMSVFLVGIGAGIGGTMTGQQGRVNLLPRPLESVVMAVGVPLHIRVVRTARLSKGMVVRGVLTEPIYVRDRLVVPTGSAVTGSVIAYTPTDHMVREQALLNGDVTPLHDPIVQFSSVHLAEMNEDVAIDAQGTIRDTQMVKFSTSKKRSFVRQAIDGAKAQVHATYEAAVGPNKRDRALQFLYQQMPYHPQRIWVGTQFIADLNASASVALPANPVVESSEIGSLNGIVVDARLRDSLNSKTAKKGDAVTALVTTPVFDKENKLILPEGTEIDGLVSASKPARSFGRNGQLRFAIRGVRDLDQPRARNEETVYGTLTGAEGNAGQNLSVDAEGNVRANPDKHRFVAPFLLAMTAVAGGSQDGDSVSGSGSIGRTTVGSNGFGIVARVVALTVSSQNVALGFGAYAFAKSIYFRFLTRGHEVTFPKDTQLEVTLSTR